MTAARLLAIAVVVMTLPLPAVAQEAVSLEAPRPVRAQLNRLAHADPAVRAEAAAELAKDDKHAPFLRLERIAAVTVAHRAALDAALAPVEARIRARTRERMKDWAKERRLDLLGHLLADGPEADVADVVDRILAVQHEILTAAWPDTPSAERGIGFAPARSLAGIRPLPGLAPVPPITPTPGDGEAPDGLAFAGRRVFVSASGFERAGLVAGATGAVRVARQATEPGLYQTVLLANGPVELTGGRRALVVADGDVVFKHPAADLWRTVVVATGSVSAVARGRVLTQHARVYAGGSIDLPDGGAGLDSVFRAGGRVRLGVPAPDDWAEGVKELPFGIRFVTPEEFGFRVAQADGGLTVAAVEAWSPLARYDVRAGDVVTRVGFDNVRTADALRRALRRGLVDEAAVFHVVRGAERLTRVVYLDGVPRRP